MCSLPPNFGAWFVILRDLKTVCSVLFQGRKVIVFGSENTKINTVWNVSRRSQNQKLLISFPYCQWHKTRCSFILVLASSVLDHRACYDPGRILCSDPSQLPHAAVAEAPFYHLLFCFRVWSHPYSPLGVAQWRDRCSYCSGMLRVVSLFPLFLSFNFIPLGKVVYSGQAGGSLSFIIASWCSNFSHLYVNK